MKKFRDHKYQNKIILAKASDLISVVNLFNI